jgi:hypothetical protein
MTLGVLRESYCICRLDAGELPDWSRAEAVEFLSLTRTHDEVSVVCPAHVPPPDVRTRSDGWRCLRVDGPLDLALTGILLRLLRPLAAAGCAVFTVSTYDTDYLLVKQIDLPRALDALRAAGYVVHD